MRNELEHIELIEKYLRGELSTVERASFKEQLKTDVNLQKEVDLQKDVVKGIERLAVKQTIQKSYQNYNNRRRGFYFGIILLLVITSGVVALNYQNKEVSHTEVITSSEVSESQNAQQEIETIADEEELGSSDEALKIEKEGIKLPSKQFQYFTINPLRDTTIIGEEGTQISFRANSFADVSSSKITIRLKEYYKISDMVFSNLTTETVDNKLLETGGMVYVDASFKDAMVELKKGESFIIKYPTKKKKDGMILFDGEEVGKVNKNIKWAESSFIELPKNQSVVVVEEDSRSEIFAVVETMPVFKGGQEALFQYLAKNTKYPVEAKNNNVSGTVYLNFIVDKNGEINDVRVLRGIHPLLDAEAIRVVKSMPSWNAGIQRGKKVDVTYNLPIRFTLAGVSPLKGYTTEQSKKYNDSLVTERKKEIEDNLFKNESQDSKANNIVEEISKYDITSYVFSSSNFGWLNCDRFVNINKPKIKLTFVTDDSNADVKLIFHSIKGMMAGYGDGKYSKFNNVPTGEKVTVVAIKFMDKRPFICVEELRVSDKIVALEFVELTKENLRRYTEVINKI